MISKIESITVTLKDGRKYTFDAPLIIDGNVTEDEPPRHQTESGEVVYGLPRRCLHLSFLFGQYTISQFLEAEMLIKQARPLLDERVIEALRQ